MSKTTDAAAGVSAAHNDSRSRDAGGAERLGAHAELTALIAARIDRLPASRWHLMVLVLLGTASLFDAYDIAVIAFVMPVLIGLWHLSASEVGLIFSSGFAGLALGAALFGWLAERYGRIPILTVTIAMLSVFGLGCAFSTNFPMLLTFRFLQGLALGGELPVAVTYVTELSKSSRRGQIIALYQFTAPLGFLGASFGGLWIVPHLGWQALFVIGALPALVTLVLRRLVPESPRWLAKQGRNVEAERNLSIMEAKAAATTGPLPPVSVTAVTPPPVPGDSQQGRFTELFSPFYRLRTLSLWIIWVCASVIGYGLLIWLPTIFRTIYKMPIEDVLRLSTMSSVGSICGAIIAILLVDHIGRRPIFIAAFSVAAVAMLTLWYLSQQSTITAIIVMALGAVTTGFIGMVQITLWGYTSESYPTRMRAFASGTASVWGRVSTLVMPIVVGFMLSRSGVNVIFLSFGLLAAVGALAVVLFALETRGRLLEELSP